MIKERISLSGNFKSKVRQLMGYAGWYEQRSVDISIAEQYYAERGVPMMKSTQRFYHKYFGLCCEWYLEQKRWNGQLILSLDCFRISSMGLKAVWKMYFFGICLVVNYLLSGRGLGF